MLRKGERRLPLPPLLIGLGFVPTEVIILHAFAYSFTGHQVEERLGIEKQRRAGEQTQSIHEQPAHFLRDLRLRKAYWTQIFLGVTVVFIAPGVLETTIARLNFEDMPIV